MDINFSVCFQHALSHAYGTKVVAARHVVTFEASDTGLTSIRQCRRLRSRRRLLSAVLLRVVAFAVVRGAVHVIRGDEVVKQPLVELLQTQWSTGLHRQEGDSCRQSMHANFITTAGIPCNTNRLSLRLRGLSQKLTVRAQ